MRRMASFRRPLVAGGAICLLAIALGVQRLEAWIRPPAPVYLTRQQALERVLEPGVCGSTVRVSYRVSRLARQHGRAVAEDGRQLYPEKSSWPASPFSPSEFWVAELRATGPGFDAACRLVLDAENGAILRELGNSLSGDPGVGGG